VHVVAVQQTGVIVQRASPLAGPRAMPSRSGAFGPPVAQVASATGQTLRPVSVRAVVGPRPQWSRSRETGTAAPGARATGSPRAQSPMQSPRAQQSQPASSGGWKRSSSQSVGTSRARGAGWGGARAGSGARWGNAPSSSGARGAPAAGAARGGTGSGGAVRAAPSAPRAPSAAPQGGGGARSGGGHSGGARASGGHGRRSSRGKSRAKSFTGRGAREVWERGRLRAET